MFSAARVTSRPALDIWKPFLARARERADPCVPSASGRMMRNDLVTDKSAASTACRAIADPTRRKLLDVLLAGPASAGALAKRFSTSRPAIARHLAVLR